MENNKAPHEPDVNQSGRGFEWGQPTLGFPHPYATPVVPGELFYRVLADDHLKHLQKTETLTYSGETFISPNREYVEKYTGITVQFHVKPGTQRALESLGVRDHSHSLRATYPYMPEVSKGWSSGQAFFKMENGVVNIGLGKGLALEMFNERIIEFLII